MKNRVASSCVAGLILSLGLFAAPTLAQHDHDTTPAKPAAAQPAESKRVGDAYPLTTCPVGGKKLGTMGDPIIKVYEGREVRFCCNMCPPGFEKDAAKSMAKLDEAIIKDQLALYPLHTSIISSKPLGEKPVDFVYGNRLVRVSDAGEKTEFLKDPKKYLPELDKAVIAAQGKDYPLTKCPVSDEALGGMGEVKNIVVAGRLVRLCCGSCVKEVDSNPAKIIAAVDEARKSKTGGDGQGDKAR